MVLVGIVVLGIASILVATASAPISAVVRPGAMEIEATFTQIVLVVLVGSILGLALGGRSRVAYVGTLAIGAAAIGWWLLLVTDGHPAAFDRVPVIVAAAGLLVVTGLLLDGPAFWGSARGSDVDEAVSPPPGADPWWRPPR